MIEKTVLNYLSEKLVDIPVYMEHQKNDPQTFVILEKTGSSRENYINRSTFAIQSYASSMLKAAELNETVKNLMDDIVALDEIVRSEINTDYNYTDTTKKQYRYQAVYDITHY